MADRILTPSILAAAGPSPLWYLTRASGLVSLILLTAVMGLGIASLGRWASERWPRFATAGLHRGLSLLAVVFLLFHIVTAELDTFAPIGWLAFVVPFVSSYRALWLGLGTVAFDLILALVVTSLLRNHIGYKTWKALHWASYACWPIAVLHGLGTGSDPRLAWVKFLVAACIAAVAVAGAWRLTYGWPSGWQVRLASLATAIVVLVAGAVWAVGGPFKHGWAKKAGTPAALLAGKKSAAGSGSAGNGSAASGPASVSIPAPPFSASLNGTIDKTGPTNGQETTTINTQMSGGATGPLQLVLHGRPSGSGTTLQSSTVSLGGQYHGQLTSLNGASMAASVAGAGKPSLNLGINLQINNQAGTVSGTMQAQQAGSGK